MCAAARGYSLHIGLNFVNPVYYEDWNGELIACEYDADDMEALAASAGYETEKLIREAATRDAVIDGIRNLAAKARSGDICLVNYSGHGGQIPDLTGEERDSNDETWCLFDGQLLDDELELLWHDFEQDVRILVVSDSCHSGTITRALPPVLSESVVGVGARVRTPSRALLRRVYQANRVFYDGVQTETASALAGRRNRDLRCTVRLLSGCMDEELSYDGDDNGVFTAALLATWDFGRFSGDYRRFHHTIAGQTGTLQTPQHNIIGRPNSAFDGQRPFTIVDAASIDPASRTLAWAAVAARPRNNSQRATQAIEQYIRAERPGEINSWRAKKPDSDWRMSSTAWRGVGKRIIGNFNDLDPSGAQIDPDEPEVKNAIENLHDEALAVFHQYLTQKSNQLEGASRVRRFETSRAETIQ